MKYTRIVLFHFYSFLAIIILMFGQIARADHHDGSNASVTGVVGAIVDDSCRVGKEERVAIKMALQDFHEATNQSLNLHIRSSRGDQMQAALAARHLITRKGVQAILGPDKWEEISLVAKVGTENHIPVVSFANAYPKWATELWPFLVQVSSNMLNQTKAIAAIVQSWEWYQVNILYEDNSSMINDVLPHLSSALREIGSEISRLVALPPFVSSLLTEELERLKEGQCRVFVVHASVEFAVKLFDKAKEMKMMEKDYVWITTDAITNFVHSFNASTFSSMQGVLGVKSHIREDEHRWQDFYHRFRKIFSSKYPKEYNHEPGIFAVQAYDATWTMALAMRGNNKRGQELLAQILKSDFQGISSRKVQFNHQRSLAPEHTFQIINVLDKSYRELGFWSEQLGFFKTIGGCCSNKSSMKDLGLVLWPGEPWSPPSGWTIPTSSKPLRIGVPSASLFKQIVSVEHDQSGNNSLSFSGFAIDVFEAMVEKLPFDLHHKFEPFNLSSSYNELVKQIYLKKFDAVVGDVAIVAKRFEYAEFTHPYTDTGLVMVVPVRSKTSNKAWLFLKPFTTSMWVLIVVVNVFNGFVVWLIERNHCPELKGSKLNQIGTLFWLAFSTLFSLHGDKLHSNLSRMTMLVWLFVALVITQTYTANLTSMLTVQQLEPDVDPLQSSNAMFGYCKGSYLQSYLTQVLGYHTNKIKQFDSQEAYAQALKSREIAAIFLEAPLAKLFLAKHCKGFTIIGPTYKVGGFGFAFPRRYPLLPSINKALLEVSESGKLQELEKGMLESEKCTSMETDNESGPHSLCLTSFWVLFVLTIGTSTIALVIYIFSIARSTF